MGRTFELPDSITTGNFEIFLAKRLGWKLESFWIFSMSNSRGKKYHTIKLPSDIEDQDIDLIFDRIDILIKEYMKELDKVPRRRGSFGI